MKKIFSILFSAIVLILTIHSCSQNDEINNTNKANKEMAKILKSKYGIKTKDLGNGKFEFEYLDGRVLKVSQENEKIIFSGTRINNQFFELNSLSKNEAIENLKLKSDQFLNSIPKQQFIKNVNSYSKLSPNQLAKTASESPCDEHSSNEEFDECVEREIKEFCDSFIGCLALATNPVIVIGVIAAHCAIC